MLSGLGNGWYLVEQVCKIKPEYEYVGRGEKSICGFCQKLEKFRLHKHLYRKRIKQIRMGNKSTL